MTLIIFTVPGTAVPVDPHTPDALAARAGGRVVGSAVPPAAVAVLWPPNVTVRHGDQPGELMHIRADDPDGQGQWSFSPQPATPRGLDRAFFDLLAGGTQQEPGRPAHTHLPRPVTGSPRYRQGLTRHEGRQRGFGRRLKAAGESART